MTRWYGGPRQEAFKDAVEGYRSGYFDGKYVFNEADPGATNIVTPESSRQARPVGQVPDAEVEPAEPLVQDPHKAGIRIDLSRIKAAEDSK
ncbi:hypothetical protein [Ensifer sp. 22564]|uniref:hypothetical protein n=1 Tax=Ensifer sp. 22564 TaxID=3453943 RepID=UPI003F851FAF